ncbi:MAG: hypothetical protein QOF01_2346 [Thermomicrobiales bacterium]|nr:hypothetical protein [Thermomicrobiales bacterium]
MTPRRIRPSPVRPTRVGSRTRPARALLPADTARSLVVNGQDGLLVVGGDGAVAFANRSARQLVGGDGESLIGRRFDDLVPTAVRGAWQALPAAAKREGALPFPPTIRIPLPGGGERIVEAVLDDRTDDASVQGVVVHLRDTTAQTTRVAKLAQLAYHDPITRLPNRTRFCDLVARALEEATAARSTVAVLMVDLDRFKQVNDAFGHAAGDRLLADVGRRLRGALRTEDIVSRLGGDEFACLLVGPTTLREAVSLAERVLAALSAPADILGQSVVPGASVGVACVPAAGSNVDDILAAADMALYEAKRRGRGRVACFEERLDREVRARAVLEGELRRGILADEFRLEFQPLVHLASGSVRQAEALIRWQHPARGLLRPDAFVPLAEEAGLVLPLGRWVLREACRQAISWPGSRGRFGAAVNVNLSSVQLRHPGLVREVIGALHESGLDPRQLTLELTESTALDDLDGTIAALERLRVLGVRFALDDFGTGHSSLGYLHRLPVDEVKIDRSFVSSLTTNRVASAVVQAVVTVATAVGVGVVAEGIESLDQLRAVTNLGCNVGQGFLLGRPVGTARFIEFLDPVGESGLRAS